jgi:selenocysteine lyase/cysteine desulfurase
MEPAEEFLDQYPNYRKTGLLDELRSTDYSILDRQGHVYLDYTGGGLFAASQLAAHQALLSTFVFGNPHSYNPTSAKSTELIEQTRHSVLRFFNAPEDEYVCIFTQNASGALKIVGEAYPLAQAAAIC